MPVCICMLVCQGHLGHHVDVGHISLLLHWSSSVDPPIWPWPCVTSDYSPTCRHSTSLCGYTVAYHIATCAMMWQAGMITLMSGLLWRGASCSMMMDVDLLPSNWTLCLTSWILRYYDNDYWIILHSVGISLIVRNYITVNNFINEPWRRYQSTTTQVVTE